MKEKAPRAKWYSIDGDSTAGQSWQPPLKCVLFPYICIKDTLTSRYSEHNLENYSNWVPSSIYYHFKKCYITFFFFFENGTVVFKNIKILKYFPRMTGKKVYSKSPTLCFISTHIFDPSLGSNVNTCSLTHKIFFLTKARMSEKWAFGKIIKQVNLPSYALLPPFFFYLRTFGVYVLRQSWACAQIIHWGKYFTKLLVKYCKSMTKDYKISY